MWHVKERTGEKTHSCSDVLELALANRTRSTLGGARQGMKNTHTHTHTHRLTHEYTYTHTQP